MPVIRKLDSHVANLIAAGEVVERPASVVKELMENSIDAGAHSITVELVRGGLEMIRVTDDGCGIPPDQAATAFLRHATSKISSEEDLTAIGTLGFRGEALAAIAAVSHVELITRTEDAPMGLELHLDGGEEAFREETGCPLGTTMVVRDLFYNTPARLKFMRTDRYEGGVVANVVQEVALSHPELAVRLIRDGHTGLSTPGDGKMMSTLYAVLGRDIALGFVEVRDTVGDLQVEGFVTKPNCCKPSRTTQHVFVNGRYVQNRLIQAAVEQAYANTKMVGKFPGFVLYLTMPRDQVDVNVHPTKAIVKFQDDGAIFDAVSRAVQAALERDRTMVQFGAFPRRMPAEDTVTAAQTQIPMGRPAVPVQQPAQTAAPAPQTEAALAAAVPLVQPAPPSSSEAPAVSAAPAAPVAAVPPGKTEPAAAPQTPSRPAAVFQKAYSPIVSHPQPAAPKAESSPYHQVEPLPPEPEQTYRQPAWVKERVANPSRPFTPGPGQPGWNPLAEIVQAIAPLQDQEPPAPAAGSAETPTAASEEPQAEVQPWVVRGEIFRTYVVVEQGNQVIFIDKHAAHERANFDRMKAEDYKPMVQELLMPITFRPSPVEREILLGNLPLLQQYGFELEEYGAAAVAVRAAPDYLDAGEIEGALLEVAEKIRTTGRGDPESARDELLHTMACKAAIKGGWQTQAAELEAVAELVMSGKVKYCPHGRPVSISISRSRLEREFKR